MPTRQKEQQQQQQLPLLGCQSVSAPGPSCGPASEPPIYKNPDPVMVPLVCAKVAEAAQMSFSCATPLVPHRHSSASHQNSAHSSSSSARWCMFSRFLFSFIFVLLRFLLAFFEISFCSVRVELTRVESVLIYSIPYIFIELRHIHLQTVRHPLPPPYCHPTLRACERARSGGAHPLKLA